MRLVADAPGGVRPRYSPAVSVSFVFVAIAAVCLLFADIGITTLDPWTELKRMLLGVLTPDFFAVESIGTAVVALAEGFALQWMIEPGVFTKKEVRAALAQVVGAVS